jgi:DNA-directed RNA polymerase specialized sigma24 family protein
VEFCRIFEKDMNRLYLLSFLLTADHPLAAECFVHGLEDALRSNRMLKELAEAWARRMVIENAIQMIHPQPTAGGVTVPGDDQVRADGERLEIAAMVALPAFERFVFVMSVLERYSDQECSVLLDRSRAEVRAARTRALQQVGSAVELCRKGRGCGTQEAAQREVLGSTSRQEVLA